jgi:zinc transport system substrate-binding protein
MRKTAFLPLLLAAPLLAGCASNEPHPDVMATFYPLAWLAERIGGGDVSVGSIVKEGVEPHDYDPTTTDLAKIVDARLLVVQGAGFEKWIQTARSQAANTKVVTATAGIDLHTGDPSEPDAANAQDPHTWTDPALYARMARNVEAAMAETFPGKAAGFHARADALVADLNALDREFRSTLAHCQTPFVITGHAAFGYMAQEYNFTQLGIQGLDPDAEPDTATINHVVEEARAHNVTVIFFEDTVSPRLAQTIADEVHAETRVLSPLEAIPQEKIRQGASYLTVQRENLANLRDAMRCP